eukprot:Hpha_TRINITY_DN5144_c1_g1::TRINITY_DN5144_c1_g1_i1::g.192978::m.192978
MMMKVLSSKLPKLESMSEGAAAAHNKAESLSTLRGGLRTAPADATRGGPLDIASLGRVRGKTSSLLNAQLREMLTLPQHKDVVLSTLDERIKGLSLQSFKAALATKHPQGVPEEPTTSPIKGSQQLAIGADAAAASEEELDALRERIRSFRGSLAEMVTDFPVLKELVRAVGGEYGRLCDALVSLCEHRPDARLQRALASCSAEVIGLRDQNSSVMRRCQEAEHRCRNLEHEVKALRKEKKRLTWQVQEVSKLFGGIRELFPDIFGGGFGQATERILKVRSRSITGRSMSMRSMRSNPLSPSDWDEDDEEEFEGQAHSVNAILQKMATEIESLRADPAKDEQQDEARGAEYLEEIVELRQSVEEWRAKADAAEHRATELSQLNASMNAELQAATEVRVERDRLLNEADVSRQDYAWLRLQSDLRQSISDSLRRREGAPPPTVCSRFQDFGPICANSWAAKVPGRHKRDRFETFQRKGAPPFLKGTTKIPTCRYRLMSQQEAKLFIKEMMSARSHFEQMAHIGKQSIDEYFQTYLHQKYNITEMMLEYSYSVHDVAVRNAHKDYDFALWVRLLERTLPDAVWEAAEEVVEMVRAALPVQQKAKTTAVPLQQLLKVLVEIFPFKTPERLAMLQCAAMATSEGVEMIERDILFGETSRLVNELKRQLVHEQDEITYAVWRILVAQTATHTDEGDAGSVPFANVPAALKRILSDSVDVDALCALLWTEVEKDLASAARRKGRGLLAGALAKASAKANKTSPTGESPRSPPGPDSPKVSETPVPVRDVVATMRRTLFFRPARPGGITIDWSQIAEWPSRAPVRPTAPLFRKLAKLASAVDSGTAAKLGS